MNLKAKRTIGICVAIVTWGMLAGTLANYQQLSGHSFEVGLIMLVNYSSSAIFSTIYLGFLACKVDLMNPIENQIWSCLYTLIAMLLIPTSILQLVMIAVLFVKASLLLSKPTLIFIWISAAIGVVYALGMISYAFGSKILDNLRKNREITLEKKYKIGTDKLNILAENGIFDSELYVQVYKDRTIKIHPLEMIELAYLKRYFEKSILTNINSNILHGEPFCPICQNDWQIENQYYQLPICKHSFDKDCLERWMTQSIHCPICKQNIRKHLVESLSKKDLTENVKLLPFAEFHSCENAGRATDDFRIPITI